MSLLLITWVPAITAMRSKTTAAETVNDKTRMEASPRILKGLPDREEELEMADILRRAFAIIRQLRKGDIGIAVQDLSRRPRETHIGGRVDTVCEIRPDGPHRRAIAHPKSNRVDHIVEILRIVLMKAK